MIAHRKTSAEVANLASLKSGIDYADQVAEKIGQKLQVMANILTQIDNEKDDFIRAQLARFFKVLQAFIDEALHPTGNQYSDRILFGKSVQVHIDDSAIVVHGKRINLDSKGLNLNRLSKSQKNEDVHAIMPSITKVQASVKKLRSNLASARLQIMHHSNRSSTITL